MKKKKKFLKLRRCIDIVESCSMLPREKRGVVDAQLKVSLSTWKFLLESSFSHRFQFAHCWCLRRSSTYCFAHSKFVRLYLFLKTSESHFFGNYRIRYWKRLNLYMYISLFSFTDQYSAADFIKSHHILYAWYQLLPTLVHVSGSVHSIQV